MRSLIFRILNRLFLFWTSEKIKEQLSRLKNCGVNVVIDRTVTLWGIDGISIADDVVINGNTFIFGSGGVQIGSRVQISANCVITSVTHSKAILDRNQNVHKSVSIEDDVWIGAGTVILPGILIGRGSIVGAGSIVTRNIPPYSIAYGNPARIKEKINEN